MVNFSKITDLRFWKRWEISGAVSTISSGKKLEAISTERLPIPALSMKEAKLKLAVLERYLPNAVDDIVYRFGRFVAGYLNPQLFPQGFVMACQTALYDLQKGVDGTGKPIRNSLVGYPLMIYALLSMEIPEIAEAIFPPEFAAGVKEFVEEVNRKMEEAN